ncbi:uncharacterized protein WM294_001136 [Sarcoramphus papa]
MMLLVLHNSPTLWFSGDFQHPGPLPVLLCERPHRLLFHHLSSQILGCLGALCCVGSDNWPGLPETAWTEPGVKVGPQIPYWKGTSNPAKLSALKGLQREEGKFRVPPPQLGALCVKRSRSRLRLQI